MRRATGFATATMNPIHGIAELGQSPWLAFTTRDLIRSRELERLILEDGLCGLTTNPTIFERAIAGSGAYDADIIALCEAGFTPDEILRRLMVDEVQEACDAFRDLHEASLGRDGFVSLELPPHAAHDTEALVAEARETWARVSRRNLMLKIPATRAGVAAIEECLTLGLNVNATQVLSLRRYRAVCDAHLSALGARRVAGLPLDRLASVASCFVGRVDVAIDAELDAIGTPAAHALRGQAGLANAALIYEAYLELLEGAVWGSFAHDGARPQRPLWTSLTSPDAAASPLRYIEALIAPATATAMTPDVLLAYRNEGQPEVRLDDAAIHHAHAVMASLGELGISLERTAARVGQEAVAAFTASWDALLTVVERKANCLASRA